MFDGSEETLRLPPPPPPPPPLLPTDANKSLLDDADDDKEGEEGLLPAPVIALDTPNVDVDVVPSGRTMINSPPPEEEVDEGAVTTTCWPSTSTEPLGERKMLWPFIEV